MATNMQNRRIVLANRPKDTASVDNFRMETVPAAEPAEGEVWCATASSPSIPTCACA